MTCHPSERFFSVARLVRRVTLELQDLAERAPNVGMIVHDQNWNTRILHLRRMSGAHDRR